MRRRWRRPRRRCRLLGRDKQAHLFGRVCLCLLELFLGEETVLVGVELLERLAQTLNAPQKLPVVVVTDGAWTAALPASCADAGSADTSETAQNKTVFFTIRKSPSLTRPLAR